MAIKADDRKLVVDILLKEYELAQSAAFEMDRSLWNYALVVVGALIANTVIPLFSTEPLTLCWLAILCLIYSLIWFIIVLMMQSTDRMIQCKFQRCREIEKAIMHNVGVQGFKMRAHRSVTKGLHLYKFRAKDGFLLASGAPPVLHIAKGYSIASSTSPSMTTSEWIGSLLIVIAVMAIYITGIRLWRMNRGKGGAR